ncbi:FYVE zinc finger domain-containing protein [Phytophthora infestans]|uniref:FYVE zinc finger domain-containing protein n=1 Tax=Phytophthora infestans TaxID=4787 RepID=A0A8S9TW44_PHYIN|nr:FYVE zinc finger domain-containing protein [Phytophthora infestans]
MRDELRGVEEDRGETGNRGSPSLSEAMAGQGRYVVPFTMSREEEAVGMDLARSQLTKLMDECAASRTDESWTRVKCRKSNGVVLWEKRSTKAKRESKRKKWASIPTSTSVLGLDEGHGPVTYSVRSSTTVRAPLNTVLKTLDASVATTHRSFNRIIYGNLVADTSVLYHSSTPSTNFLDDNENDSFESLAVRWFVCRCSNPMISDCDFCLQEYTKRYSIDELASNGDHYNNNKWEHDDVVSSSNREGLHPIGEIPLAYKLFRSMETRHCPELLQSHRVVRCKVPLGGFLLYPTDSSDKTDVVFFMSIAQDNPNTYSGNPALNSHMLTQCSDRQFRAFQSVVRQMALQIGRLDNAVDSYKMSQHLESLRTLQWVRNAERTECVVCFRRFHQLTRRRHHCRLCGEVICRECSVHKDIDLPTFGPTALRICISCNQMHSSRSQGAKSSSPQSPEKRRTRRGTLTTTRSDKSRPPVSQAPRRRSSTLAGDSAKMDESRAYELTERRFVEETQRRKDSEQPASCPKPAASPVIDRRYFAIKWGGARIMKPSIVTTAPNTPKEAPSPFGIHRSSSATFSASPHKSMAIKDRLRSKDSDPQLNDREDEDKFETYASNNDFEWNSQSSRALIYAVRNGILLDNNFVKSNQQATARAPPQQDRPLIYRSFESLQMYEDIFLKLCENSASVRRSRFVALTLFTQAEKEDQQNESKSEESAVYYLKVEGRAYLMNTAASLRCCEPVLQLNKPVITRNTLTLDGKCHPSGYAFRQLPIVMGPQQAKFYAGVPLTDPKNRYRYGAIAIFDNSISRGEDDDLPMKKTLQALQVCVREAVMAVDERRKELELRTFLQAPLIQLRQSEPALHLSMDISQSSPDWRDIESLDGDSDDDKEEAECRLDQIRNARMKSDPEYPNSGSPSVGKARVKYFRNKMQELVRQAQDTQAQLVENTLVMERHGVPIV